MPIYPTYEQWLAAFTAAMMQLWAITPADAGVDDDYLQRWYADHTETGVTVLEAAQAYGDDYDLNEADPWTRDTLRQAHPIPDPVPV